MWRRGEEVERQKAGGLGVGDDFGRAWNGMAWQSCVPAAPIMPLWVVGLDLPSSPATVHPLTRNLV
jgi:hypothetical protein